jgi:hypothetical protein
VDDPKDVEGRIELDVFVERDKEEKEALAH